MNDGELEIKQEDRDGVKIIKVKGRMEAETYPNTEKTIMKMLEEENYQILIDMEELEYINSSGWVVFIGNLKLARDNRGDIKLCCMNDQVSDVFKQMGLDYIIHVYGNIEDAVKAFKK